VYGVTFPDKKQMEEYKKRMEEAKKRDHRRLGTQQKLFFFDPVSPGSAFFLPRGMTICRRLIQVS
jgi:threonyl-tRNA synthetase